MEPIHILDARAAALRRKPLELKLVEPHTAREGCSDPVVDLGAMPSDRVWSLEHRPGAGFCAVAVVPGLAERIDSGTHTSAQAAIDEAAMILAADGLFAPHRGMAVFADAAGPSTADMAGTAAGPTRRVDWSDVAVWAVFGAMLGLVAAALFWQFGQ